MSHEFSTGRFTSALMEELFWVFYFKAHRTWSDGGVIMRCVISALLFALVFKVLYCFFAHFTARLLWVIALYLYLFVLKGV